jgi:two-component system sensor histidine kinase AtoS
VKKKLIIVLTVFSLLAFIGGINLLLMTGRIASSFNDLIELHQVEIMREHLLLNVYQVQEDLYSQSARHPESRDAILNHMDELDRSVNACFGCHHTADVTERLQDLRHQIGDYSQALTTVLTLGKRVSGIRQEQEKAHLIGESLISKINTMIVLTNKKLIKRTEDVLRHQQQTTLIVVLLVAAGPLLIAVLGFMTIGRITRPIQTLLAATKRLKAGDLDSRIEGLTDEFAEFAFAFNDMAGSLKEHMRAIQESEKRYRLLFESAGDAIFILEAEGEQAGKIVQANQAAAIMHGYTVDELMTMNIADVDSPEAVLGVPIRLERLLAGERVQTEITHRRKDGTIFPVEISAAMFEVGAKKYILAIDRNVTERKQSEEALQRAQQIRLAGELATGLAHEIKNPLAGIKVSMEALSEETYLHAEDRDVLKKVIDEIKRIEYLMKGLLSFAKPPKPHFIETDVNAILETVASLALKDRSRIGDGPDMIHIVRDFKKDLPEILADPMQLQQVFMNVLLNAVDAMPEGGTLIMKTYLDESIPSVRIDICDTGKGVDLSVMDKLFQPFFTTKPKGTGLGLAITRRLIEEHGGRIRLENNLEGGATFSMCLPVIKREGAKTS